MCPPPLARCLQQVGATTAIVLPGCLGDVHRECNAPLPATQVTGEASPSYLFDARVPAQVGRALTPSKPPLVVAVLRDPVRAGRLAVVHASNIDYPQQ